MRKRKSPLLNFTKQRGIKINKLCKKSIFKWLMLRNIILNKLENRSIIHTYTENIIIFNRAITAIKIM